MNKKQTAVDYLIKVLSNYDSKMIELFIKEIDQAKEMEKQQIIEARVTAPLINSPFESDYKKEAEQYYNETFNN